MSHSRIPSSPSKELLLKNRRNERQRQELANSKHQDKIDANRETVDLLNKMCQKEGYIGDSDFGEEHLEHCTLEMFGRLNNKELGAFIMARQSSVKPEFASKSKLPNKGQC